MKFDFYLSEMSVSDKHGGGLTLQRILGDDLLQIPRFFYVNRFAADYPAKDVFLPKSTEIRSVWETDIARKLLGRSLSFKMSRKPQFIKQHAQRAARAIASAFKDKSALTALICPQSANAIYTLEALKRKRSVKYVTWVMDDHLIQYVNGDWQYPDGTGDVFKKHLQEAAHVFVISPAMQQFYLEQFGVSSTVLFGSAGELNIHAVQHLNGPLKLGYFGAVAAWQRDALKAVADALQGTDTTLDIYSGVDSLPGELISTRVTLKGSLKPEDVPAAMKNYDAVLLPISFQQKMRNMSQFNIATKMSEYLACGVPILSVGPPYAAMTEYLKQHDAAITVISTEKDGIRQALHTLTQPQRIQTILHNAKQLVDTQVGAKPMRNTWLQGLEAAEQTQDLHHIKQPLL